MIRNHKHGLILVSLFCVVFLVGSVVSVAGEPLDSVEESEQQIHFVFIGGHSDLLGSSQSFHLSPLWLQGEGQWVSFGFDKATVVIIDGVPLFLTSPCRLYMEGFKGIAPGSALWTLKNTVGLRMRVVGVCGYYELHR